MQDFLIIGTAAGLIFGLMHLAYLTRLVTAENSDSTASSSLSALNFAGWTLLLWLLMGAYVLAFWLVGFVFYIIFKAFR